jgi:hypothetical protein
MEEGLFSFLSVSIDFERSHLYFPRIVHWVLAILFALILIFRVRPFLADVRAGRKRLPFVHEDIDKLRLFGTIFLIIVYFYLMDVVGRMFPYTGYGFLFMSVIFVFLLSLLYLSERTRRNYVIITINALVAPLVAWFVFARMFNITLP